MGVNDNQEEKKNNNSFDAMHSAKDAYDFGKMAFDAFSDKAADTPNSQSDRGSSNHDEPYLDGQTDNPNHAQCSHKKENPSGNSGSKTSNEPGKNSSKGEKPNKNSGQQSANAAGDAQKAKDAASAGAKAGTSTADAISKGIGAGAKVAAKAGAAAATGGASAATGAGAKAAKAAKNTTKALKAAAQKNAERQKKDEKGDKNKLLIFAMIIAIFSGAFSVFSLMGSIHGSNPMIFIKAMTINNYEQEQEAESHSNFLDDCLNKIEAKQFYAKDLGNDLSEQSVEAFKQVKDYDQAVSAMTVVVHNYLDKAYEEAYGNIPDTKEFNGQVYTVDKELTQAEFKSQGDPFANVDLACIVAAYAVAASGEGKCSVKEMDKLFDKASEDFLKVEYKWDSVDDDQNKAGDGNINTLETITPMPVYKYDKEKMTLTANQYLDYLSVLKPGDKRIKKVVKDTQGQKQEDNQKVVDDYKAKISDCETQIANLNAQISAAQTSINNLNASLANTKDTKVIASINAQIATLTANINSYNNSITNYNNQIATYKTEMAPYEQAVAGCKATLDNLDEATAADIATEYMDSEYEATVYHIAKNKKGEPIEIDEVVEKEGKEEKDYGPFMTKDGVEYCAYIGKSLWYPKEVVDRHYAEVVLTPYSNDVADVLAMFDLKPEDAYEPSQSLTEKIFYGITGANKMYDGVTNQIQFKNYYDVLKERTNLAGYSATAGATHACSLTKEEIKAYVDAAVSQYPNLSLNRQQLIKTAISLTGAIYYQWGGYAKNPGWNDDWWSETGNPEYPYVGLDCSHFVQWAYWTGINSGHQGLAPTGNICTNAITTAISKDQILPGDLGVIYYGGSASDRSANHVGIYIGKNENGEMLWCHCTGGKQNTVVVNNTNCFKVFLRVNGADLEGSGAWQSWDDFKGYGYTVANADVMYVITKCLMCEDSSDVGLMATSEAVCNAIALGGQTPSEQTMYEKCTAQNYLVAGSDGAGNYISQYQAIFVNKTKDPGEPTQNQYQIIGGSISGRRQYIQDARVGYWRSKTIKSVRGMTWYGQFPQGTGNNFFYYN